MKRYLIFDASCSLCRKAAHTLLNAAGAWIDDALSIHDNRTKELLSAAGQPIPSGPAIVELKENGLRVSTGLMFRMRVLLAIGPARTFRLARVLAGDWAAAEQPRSPSSAEGTAERRGFLRLMTNVVAGVSVVTGIGFAKPAKSAPAIGAGSHDYFTYPWMLELNFPERHYEVEGAELNAVWQEFIRTPNVARLLSSADFLAYKAAPAIQIALLTETLPELMVLGKADYVRTDRAKVKCTRRIVDDGRVVTILATVIGTSILSAVDMKRGKEVLRSELRLYEANDATKQLMALATLSHGTFAYKRDGLFAPAAIPPLAVPSTVRG